MLLGDLGATVVHIDPPEGPMWDSPANATLNRAKVIVNLDLKSQDGLEKARSLCAEVDIIVENFRPGKVAKLGFDSAAMREERPELITVSVPGFASNAEERRTLRAYESIVSASSGVYRHGAEPVVLATATGIGLCITDRGIRNGSRASIASANRPG